MHRDAGSAITILLHHTNFVNIRDDIRIIFGPNIPEPTPRDPFPEEWEGQQDRAHVCYIARKYGASQLKFYHKHSCTAQGFHDMSHDVHLDKRCTSFIIAIFTWLNLKILNTTTHIPPLQPPG